MSVIQQSIILYSFWDMMQVVDNDRNRQQAGHLMGHLLAYRSDECRAGFHTKCEWTYGNWSVACSCRCHPENKDYPNVRVEL